MEIVLNGDVYFGDVKGRIPHGRCKYTWSYGTVYEGGWEEGKMTALRTSLKAIKAMLNLQLGIRAMEIVLNGDVYFGDVKGRIPHGRCKYTWSYGTVYEGGWEEGKMTALRTSLKAIKAMLNLQLGISKGRLCSKILETSLALGLLWKLSSNRYSGVLALSSSTTKGAQATKFLQLCRFDKNCSMTFQQQRCNNDINKHFHEPLTYEHRINKKKFKLNATSSDNPQSDATYDLIKPQKVCYRFLGCSI
ncbi:MORN motif-containing protein [Artemisia annua]|uniref:MORN motif-containing protein n=1 Tax=Artemisia annua TaxID=35608 RepID=A0A2U1KM93_ARTAN|nr:MORN motif-containing protein [Artemisia annua]